MQAVRCEACGNKALVAASSCPHCGHLFDLRDSFGELLPLTHCPTCECDYLTRDGKCRWCGTAPKGRRVEASTMWRGAGVLAFVGMAFGVWATRDSAPPPAPAAVVTTPNDSLVVPTLPAVVADTPVVLASAPEDFPRDTSLVAAAAPLNGSGSVTVDTSTGTSEAPSLPPQVAGPVIAAAPAVVVPPSSRLKPRAVSRKPVARWRNVVARDWVTVRAAPRHGSRLLGSLGPDTRIQLGESREGWVRVRIRGLSGWVHSARLSTRPVALARR